MLQFNLSAFLADKRITRHFESLAELSAGLSYWVRGLAGGPVPVSVRFRAGGIAGLFHLANYPCRSGRWPQSNTVYDEQSILMLIERRKRQQEGKWLTVTNTVQGESTDQ